MLLVIGIIGLIAALVTPAALSMVKAWQLTQGGLMVGDQLALARQTALSKNRSVEVRFYRFGDLEIPGESLSDPSKGKFRAIQLFELAEDGTAKALGKVQRLPASIIVDSGATLSTILNQSGRPVAKLSSGPALPRVGVSYEAALFRFRPDGSTDLIEPAEPSKAWFFTIHNLADGDSLAQAPSNFLTLQIDAYNGTLRTFRP
jgi:uncharacterized protein (TIGR02596 family)